MRLTRLVVCTSSMAIAGAALAGTGDINGVEDAPRTFNDFAGSDLTWDSGAFPSMSQLTENNYGPGGFANRHIGWFSEDGGATRFDYDYGDGFDYQFDMVIHTADNVGNVEAGFQFDLFGFGLFGVLSASGEIAAFGSTIPFHSFGAGVYSIGDTVTLRAIYRPGAGEGVEPNATMEYMYRLNGGMFVSSGEKAFDNLEGGFPSGPTQFIGYGAQINQPDPELGSVDIWYSDFQFAVPTPGTLGLFAFGSVIGLRRRR